MTDESALDAAAAGPDEGKRISLADVAARARVSPSTVSRVLNAKPGVSERARQRVVVALEVLGYERPEPLRRKSGGVVGVVVPELSNPVFTLFAQVIERELARYGYTQMLVSQHAGGVHEDEHVRRLLERGVSGIVFVAGIHAVHDADPSRYTSLRARGLPLAFVDGYLPGIAAPFISNDDAYAVETAMRHLVQLGHTRIGLATGPARYTTVRRRIDAFHNAYRHHLPGALGNDAVDELVATTIFSVEGGDLAARTLIERDVTALICGSDIMALGAIRGVRATGRDVPWDVSVVGSDDNQLLDFTDPPLTSVRQPVEAMSETAVQSLVEVIEGSSTTTAELIFRPELVVRASTAPPRTA
jgi:LacI family repressor for deo operon, udp, cdd, tsx, nupC, and nupG